MPGRGVSLLSRDSVISHLKPPFEGGDCLFAFSPATFDQLEIPFEAANNILWAVRKDHSPEIAWHCGHIAYLLIQFVSTGKVSFVEFQMFIDIFHDIFVCCTIEPIVIQLLPNIPIVQFGRLEEL